MGQETGGTIVYRYFLQMTKFFFAYIFVLILCCSSTLAIAQQKDRLLVFSLTKGYRHKSIKNGILAIRKLAAENGMEVDTSENVSSFTNENLSRYKTLVFLNPTGSNVFNAEQKQALVSYIKKGGGLVGIHAATDFCYEWEWYGKMIGAYFTDHPKVQAATLIQVNKKHQLNAGLPHTWNHTDEWYNFKSFNKKMKVLVKLDESSYQGGKMGNQHPIVWCHNFQGGRIFYTGMGHTPESYTDEVFLKHLLAGIRWTMSK